MALKKVRPTFLWVLIVLSIFTQAAHAEDVFFPPARRPRLELGAGAGFFYLPDYPGADESHFRVLPFPYLVYRGNILRSDRDAGVRGRFYRGEIVELDLSFDAAFPVNSSKNKARQGMEDLGWIGEVGPRLFVHVFATRMAKLNLYLPVRFAVSTDFTRVDDRGLVFNPELAFKFRLNSTATWALNAYAGITYTTERLMDYFYQVDQQYVTSTRAAYDAKAGELARNLSFFVVKELPFNITLFTGCSWNFYEHAKNEGSPLLLDNNTVSYSLGLVWRFYESDEREGAMDAYLPRH